MDQTTDTSSLADNLLMFFLAFSAVPSAAEQLIANGIFDVFFHSMLSQSVHEAAIQPYNIEQTESNSWHTIWCHVLATISSLLCSSQNNPQYLHELETLLTLYWPQISSSMGAINIRERFTYGRIQEVNHITEIFYLFSVAGDAKLSTNASTEMLTPCNTSANSDVSWFNLMSSYLERALPLLITSVWFLEHPNQLSVLLTPLTKEERELLSTSVSSTGEINQSVMGKKIMITNNSSVLASSAEYQFFKICKQILLTLRIWTKADYFLYRPIGDWAFDRALFSPSFVLETPIHSLKPLASLMNYCRARISDIDQQLNRVQRELVIKSLVLRKYRNEFLIVLENCLLIIVSQLSLYMYSSSCSETYKATIQGEAEKELDVLIAMVEDTIGGKGKTGVSIPAAESGHIIHLIKKFTESQLWR